MRATHTYAVLDISQEAYDEIRAKLEEAGYQHAFMPDGEIDMHGIAVSADPRSTALALGAAARAVGPEERY